LSSNEVQTPIDKFSPLIELTGINQQPDVTLGLIDTQVCQHLVQIVAMLLSNNFGSISPP